jgi:hypothetical integral membrane protein (TIGR02206 family)
MQHSARPEASMLEFFAKDWKGPAFELFGTPHLVGIALIVAINLFLIFGWKNPSPRAKKIFRYTLATILVVNEWAWHWWNWFIDAWTLQSMLPLHICSLMVWLIAWMLYTENYAPYEFIYFLGIGAASQAILTPDAGIYGFPHFRFLQTMISHGAIVTGAVYITVIEKHRPYWRSFVRVAIGTNVYMLAIFFLNQLIGSNYMFVARKPDTASLMDVMPAWPWYILVLEVIGFGVFLILYLPFAIKDWRAKQTGAR